MEDYCCCGSSAWVLKKRSIAGKTLNVRYSSYPTRPQEKVHVDGSQYPDPARSGKSEKSFFPELA